MSAVKTPFFFFLLWANLLLEVRIPQTATENKKHTKKVNISCIRLHKSVQTCKQ